MSLTLAGLVVAVCALSLGAWARSGPAPLPALSCPPGRLIILVHGTSSMGEFDPQAAVVRGHLPRQPDPALLAQPRHLNAEFGVLIDGAPCLLTFSYDNEYVPEGDVTRPGYNAWNHFRSPWARQPEELADHLQRLMDAYPGTSFDIVAYSAGGIVPAYWAARSATSDSQRERVHSIVIVDGIVSGYDVGAFDWACANLPSELLRWPTPEWGPLPCQFRYGGGFTSAVRGGDWPNAVPFGTARANGDLLVWYDVAGLPGRTIVDPAFQAEGCQWLEWLNPSECVLRSHGSVLSAEAAKSAIAHMIGLPP